jgi:hypothetical protein
MRNHQNSHDQFRDSKQIDKTIIDLATRPFSSQMKILLIQLLNETIRFVKETHESKKNQKILIKKIEKQKKAKQQQKIEQQKKTEKQKKIEKQNTQQIKQIQKTQKTQKIENQMKQKENMIFSEKRKRKLFDRFNDHVNFDKSKRRKIQHASFNEKFITSSYVIDDDDDHSNDDNENIIDFDYVNIDFDDDVISDFENEQNNAIVLKIIIVKFFKIQYAKLNKIEQKQFS